MKQESEAKEIAEANAICRDILQYGGDILRSDIFRQAAQEIHHLHGTVADHSLNVCIISVRLCHSLKRQRIRVSEKNLIIAALCHDLGMVGRETKYSDRKDSWQSHAEESVRSARELIPDLPDSVEEMIRSHMWPVAGPAPRTREGRLLNMADKHASSAEWASFVAKRPYAAQIKKELAKAIGDTYFLQD